MTSEISLVRSPWTALFTELLLSVNATFLIASPFLKRHQANQVIASFSKRGISDKVHTLLITDLRPECSLAGSSDLDAFADLSEKLPNLRLVHLPSIHAKVYVADQIMAVVTSANLTNGGLSGNLEYGVLFKNCDKVVEIRADFENYSLLGAEVGKEAIRSLATEIGELKLLMARAESTIETRARRAFKEKLEHAHIQLFKQRARGKTTHGILSDTILYLLSQRSLPTVELHPLIQRVHPDICDDSIDRIIGGVHFGKKWKHYVRNAQQSLKREGKIWYDGKLWHAAK